MTNLVDMLGSIRSGFAGVNTTSNGGLGVNSLDMTMLKNGKRVVDNPSESAYVNRKEWESAELNSTLNLAISRFKWESDKLTPSWSMPPQWIEYVLTYMGHGIFILNEDTGFLEFHAGVSTGKVNAFGQPTEYKVLTYNGENTKTYDLVNDPVVFVRNNAMATPDIDIILKHMKQYTEAQVKMTINQQALVATPIIVGNHDIMDSLKNLWSQITKGYPYVMLDDSVVKKGSEKGTLDELIKVFNVSAQSHLKELTEIADYHVNKMHIKLGIRANANPDKKAQMSVDEVNSSGDVTDAHNQTRHDARLQAVKDIKEKLNIDVKVTQKFVYQERENEVVGNQANTAKSDTIELNV